MNDTISKDKLIQLITIAFSEVEFPGNNNLIHSSYGDEPLLVSNHFSGKNDWKKLTPEFLDFDGALSFLSDEAFRFYIPAFMIADINESLVYNDPTVRLCWTVTPQSEQEKIAKVWNGGTVGEIAKANFDKFSKIQVSAIISYLQRRLSQVEYDYIIKQALENYWLQREKDIS